MIHFIEELRHIHTVDAGRPKRSSLLHQESFFSHIRSHSKQNSAGNTRTDFAEPETKYRGKPWQQMIIGNASVDYDPLSKQFIVTPINGGRGESYYYADLPQNIKRAVHIKHR